MTVSGIISAIIIGLIIGALGRLIVPGKQDIPIWLTKFGIVAALIGSAIVSSLRDTEGIDWVELLVQVVLAAIGVYAVAALRGRSRRSVQPRHACRHPVPGAQLTDSTSSPPSFSDTTALRTQPGTGLRPLMLEHP